MAWCKAPKMKRFWESLSMHPHRQEEKCCPRSLCRCPDPAWHCELPAWHQCHLLPRCVHHQGVLLPLAPVTGLTWTLHSSHGSRQFWALLWVWICTKIHQDPSPWISAGAQWQPRKWQLLHWSKPLPSLRTSERIHNFSSTTTLSWVSLMKFVLSNPVLELQPHTGAGTGDHTAMSDWASITNRLTLWTAHETWENI